MKSKLVILSAVGLMLFANGAMADEKGSMMEEKGSMMTEHTNEPVHVGNKICPVSGEEIGSMGDGVQVEYEGKTYNLCCAMCEKMFKKDPAMFIEKVNAELEV